MSLLQSMTTVKPGLNYLVPSSWWKQFCSINCFVQRKQDLMMSDLHLLPYVDRFLLDYHPNLIEQLEMKCNYLQLNSLKINLEINKHIEWTPVNPQAWKIIDRNRKCTHPLLTFVTQPPSPLQHTLQLQIIYCSKGRSDAFVGYMPRSSNLIAVIREVGYEMGYVQVTKSKITFIERSPEVTFTFHELEKYTIEDAPDLVIMAFNMERKTEEDETLHLVVRTDSNTTINLSNQAVVGDLNTMQDDNNSHLNERIRDRTISTGAETPFSFALSNGFDLDHEYRVNELFGAKQPEEIEEMKQLASHRIHSSQQLIPIPLGSEEFYTHYLQKLAEEILQGLTKRKSHKEKEIELGRE